MQTLEFFKYQGTGNDFIMIDDRSATFDVDDHELIARYCHRKFGIGADGLILIRNHEEADFEMVYFNADGHLTSLCGNGSRCAVMFAHQLGMVKDQCRFMTVEGILEAKIENDLVHLKLPDVASIEAHKNHYFLYTGSPHHICFVDDIENYDVFTQGRKIRQGAPYFEAGANVNFVMPISNDQLFVRTYERGVEDETLSCGTGVTAAALVQGAKGTKSPINIKTLGGELQISFEKGKANSFTNIHLIGPATMVFSGKI
jgi:diaminopimelate epimerase